MKIEKVSFFPKNGPKTMHLPVNWEIKVEGDMSNFHNKVQIEFCDRNAEESSSLPVEALLNSAGKNIAFDLVDLPIKLYSSIPYSKDFFGSKK